MKTDKTHHCAACAARSRGPATVEDLHVMHAALTRRLLAELQKEKPAAAHLEVARKFLADNSTFPSDAKTQRKLKRLHGLWVDRMSTLVADGNVSATALQETRHFLQAQKTSTTTKAPSASADVNTLLRLPFTKGPPQ